MTLLHGVLQLYSKQSRISDLFFSLLSGNGYCRSEAAVVVLLTKRSMAKRIYATIVNAGSNTDGFKEQGRP